MRHVDYFKTLNKMHHEIEAKLAREVRCPLPDALVLQKLKRKKLFIKDAIRTGFLHADKLGSASSLAPALSD
jgi:hypothetical protein